MMELVYLTINGVGNVNRILLDIQLDAVCGLRQMVFVAQRMVRPGLRLPPTQENVSAFQVLPQRLVLAHGIGIAMGHMEEHLLFVINTKHLWRMPQLVP